MIAGRSTYPALLQGPDPRTAAEAIDLEYADGLPQDMVVLDYENPDGTHVVRTYRLVDAATSPVAYAFVDEERTLPEPGSPR